MSYPNSKLSDREYRDSMDVAMEDLTIALWGFEGGPNGSAHWNDHQIVAVAAKKIEALKAMIVATGFSEKLLQTILNA